MYVVDQRELDILEGILKMKNSQLRHKFDDFTKCTVFKFGAQ